MYSYSQERVHQKLLMEISKNEEPPKLITAHDLSRSKDVRNKLLMQARAQHNGQESSNQIYPVTQRKVVARPSETAKMQQKIQQQLVENKQLHSNIKQLRWEIQKLRQVNEGLIVRLKQVQNSYRSLRSDLQKSNQQQQRKLKVNMYSDIQEYLKILVERLTLSLKQQKMTIGLESKLQTFLAGLLQINIVTVQHITKKSRLSPENETQSFQDSSRVSRTLKNQPNFKTNNQEQLPSQEHYITIMQRLAGQSRMSTINDRPRFGFASAVSQDTKFKTAYTTTPQKRKRIFQ